MPKYHKKTNIINWLLVMWAFSCASMAALIVVALQTPYLPFVSKLLATKFGPALLLVATPALVVAAASLVLLGVFTLIRHLVPETWVNTRKLLTAACLGAVLAPLVWMILVATLPWTWPVLLGLALATSLACLVLRATGMAAHYLAFGSPTAEQQALADLNEEHYGNVYGFLEHVDGIKANTPLLNYVLLGESVFDRMASQYRASEKKLAALQQGRGFFIWPFASRSQAIQRELMHSQSILSAMRMMAGKVLNPDQSIPYASAAKDLKTNIDNLVELDYKTRLAILKLLAKDYQRTSKRFIRYKEAIGLRWWFVRGRKSTIQRMERHCQSLVVAMKNLVPGPGPVAEDHDDEARIATWEDKAAVLAVLAVFGSDEVPIDALSLDAIKRFLQQVPITSLHVLNTVDEYIGIIDADPFDDQVDSAFPKRAGFTPFTTPKSAANEGGSVQNALLIMTQEDMKAQKRQNETKHSTVESQDFSQRARAAHTSRVKAACQDLSALSAPRLYTRDDLFLNRHSMKTGEEALNIFYNSIIHHYPGRQLKVSEDAKAALNGSLRALSKMLDFRQEESFDPDNLPMGFALDLSCPGEAHLKYDDNLRLQQREGLAPEELALRFDLLEMARKKPDWAPIAHKRNWRSAEGIDESELCDEVKAYLDLLAENDYEGYIGEFTHTIVALDAILFKKTGVHLPEPPDEYNFSNVTLATLQGWAELILLARDPVLQRSYLGGSFGDGGEQRCMSLCKHALRTGYSVYHRGMGRFNEEQKRWHRHYNRWDWTHGPFNSYDKYQEPPFYPDVDDLSDAKASGKYEGKDDGFYAQMFLRMAALYMDVEQFEEAVAHEKALRKKADQQTIEHDAFDYGRHGEGAYKLLSEFGRKTHPSKADQQAYADALCTYRRGLHQFICGRQRNLRLLDKSKRSGDLHVERKCAFLHQYAVGGHAEGAVGEDAAPVEMPADHFDALLKDRLKLDEAVADKIADALSEMNALEEQFHDADKEALFGAAKDANATPASRLAALREMVYRLEGKWLRLEQAVAVLLGAQGNSLFQIETGEGKTLMIALIALMKRFSPEPPRQVRILTHTDPAADEALVPIRSLAAPLGIQIGRLAIGDGDYNDQFDIVAAPIAHAVINDLQCPPQSTDDVALIVDEFDNAAIDVAASTTMQVAGDDEASEKMSDEGFIDFLTMIYQAATTVAGEFDPAALKNTLNGNPYWAAIKQSEDALRFWIKAAVDAKAIERDKRYTIGQVHETDRFTGEGVLSTHAIRIVSTETGRRDDHSIWAGGLHQMVAIKERLQRENADMRIGVPRMLPCQAEGDILSYLAQYPHKMALTGTLGEAESVAYQENIIFGEGHPPSEKAVIFPRARRTEAEYSEPPKHVVSHSPYAERRKEKQPSPVKTQWPRRTDDHEETYPVYNKRLDYDARVMETRDEHDEAIVDAIRRCQQRGLSCMVFMDTIADCDRLYQGIRASNADGLDINKIQVFDEKGQASEHRPIEPVVKENAVSPGAITITTPAGGRAIDVDVKVGIPTREHLARVLAQEKGRIGRKQAGSVYPILCAEDFRADPKDLNRQPSLHATKGFFAQKEQDLIGAAKRHGGRPKA